MNGLIQAKATLASVEAAKESVKISAALRDIEKQRDIEIPVFYVQVPNKNDGGIEEFHTDGAKLLKNGMKVKTILIKHDNTVKVELSDGGWMSFARFIKWSQW